MLVQGFKDMFNKVAFDFGETDIELFDFHPQIRVVLAVNGIFSNNKDSPLRFLWPFVCFGLAFVGGVIEIMMICHSFVVGDLSMATECFAYAVVVLVILVLYPCTLLGRSKIFEILDDMGRDFNYICSLEPRFRDKFLAGQLMIWQMGIIWMCFISVITFFYCSMTILDLLYMSLFATLDEHTVRPLIFPVWLPEDDPYRSPNYEIFLFFEYIMIYVVLFTFGAYVYILFHFLLHSLNQMDMVIMAVRELYDGLDESVVALPCAHHRRRRVRAALNRRLGQIVTWHTSVFVSVDKVMAIYGPTLVYQVLFSSGAICLMAYQVADQLDTGKFDILFALLAAGCCVQLWIPCYLGSMLMNKGFSVGDACFNSDWQDSPLSRIVVVDLCLIIMRSQRPIALQFTCIPPLNLETFSSIMSTAYSYFNMLRRMKKDL